MSSKQLQILHVHGTYNFYDCCNLECEISNTTQETGIKSASRVIHEYLKHQAPIVIGYSGWENDVIMKCLEERLSYPVPYKIIWFCYNQDAFNTLPKWLIKHSDVLFVLPKEHIETNELEESEAGKLLSAIDINRNVLPANEIFRKMIDEFRVEKPLIFENPFKYYMDIMEQYITEINEEYQFKKWVNQFRRFNETKNKSEQISDSIEKAMGDGKYGSISKPLDELSRIEDAFIEIIEYVLFDSLLPILEKSFEKEGIDISDDDLNSICDSILSVLECKITKLRISYKLERLLIFLTASRNITTESATINYYNRIIELCCIDKKLIEPKIAAMNFKALTTEKYEPELLKEIVEIGLNNRKNGLIVYVSLSALEQLMQNEDDNALKTQWFNKSKKLASAFPDDILIMNNFYSCKLLYLYDVLSDPTKIDKLIKEVANRENKELDGVLSSAYQFKILLETSDKKVLESFRELSELAVAPEALHTSTYIRLKVLEKTLPLCNTEDELTAFKKFCNIIIQDLQESQQDADTFEYMFYTILMLFRADQVVDSDAEEYIMYLESIDFDLVDEKLHALLGGLINRIIELNKDNRNQLYKIKGFVHDYIWYQDAQEKAYKLYVDNKIDKSVNLYLKAREMSIKYSQLSKSSLVDVNLAFIKRKHSCPQIQLTFKELLVENALNITSDYRCINLALCYYYGIEFNKNIAKAIETIAKMNYCDALSWWEKIEYVGEEESLVVKFLLYITKKIKISDTGLTKKDLLAKMRKTRKLPKSVVEKYNNIK
ncbi:MAG: hypothetical protein HN389_08480 [Clostridia bacterium]|nr:hypothetical protein [Clostridia bacterium]